MQLGAVADCNVFDWRQSCDFERITRVAEVHQRVEQAKSAADKVSGSMMLGLIDAAASPLMGGLSSLTIAKVIGQTVAVLLVDGQHGVVLRHAFRTEVFTK